MRVAIKDKDKIFYLQNSEVMCLDGGLMYSTPGQGAGIKAVTVTFYRTSQKLIIYDTTVKEIDSLLMSGKYEEISKQWGLT